MDAVAETPRNRVTVALERDVAGDVQWWMTAWSEQTPSGAWVYCFGYSAQGRSCTPDGHGLAGAIQMGGFSVDHAPSMSVLADRTIVEATVSFDDDVDRQLDMIDVGVPSGLQAAGFALPDPLPDTVRIVATDRAGEKHELYFKTPTPTPFEVPDGIDLEDGVEVQEAVIDAIDVPYAPTELSDP